MSDVGTDPRPRVLIVDDDETVRMVAAQALVAIGFEVEEVEDGHAALEAIDRSPPDLVLLDVDMPGIDGFETCAALRRSHSGEEIPVLIATGLTDAATIDRAFEVGATDFIAKPLDLQLLQHRVRFLMRASKAFAELHSTLSDLRDSQQRLANAQRIARVGNWELILETREMLWSEEMYRLLELPLGGASYEAFLQSVHVDDRSNVEKAMVTAASEAEPFGLEHRVVTSSGAERVVEQQVEVIRGMSGAPERVSGTLQDITDRRKAEEQIRYLAYYDSLTALPNRKMLREFLDRTLLAARERSETLGLLSVNMDRFTRINETLGHEAGDELLRDVAKRLLTGVRTTDWVARPKSDLVPVSRLGGDEFALVLGWIRSSEDAAIVARRVLEVLSKPFTLNEQSVTMTASVGIGIYPNDGVDGEALLGSANSAMHRAKTLGGDSYRFFDGSMNERAMRNLMLEGRLSTAIEREELLVYYQPQLDLRSGVHSGVEALVRWDSPELGMVMPGEFIPLAEESGLISALGRCVLRKACVQARAWQDAGLPLRLSVNVSSHQVRRSDLIEVVEGALGDAGLDARWLELEVTESALLGDEEIVGENLTALKSLGIGIALDDFGTGYSSLSHLVRFPIDTLKIDTSFVREIGRRGEADAIIPAVVMMAHRLGLSVVAEGVETEEQDAFLRAEGCDALQGYRVGRPAPAEALEELLRGESAD